MFCFLLIDLRKTLIEFNCSGPGAQFGALLLDLTSIQQLWSCREVCLFYSYSTAKSKIDMVGVCPDKLIIDNFKLAMISKTKDFIQQKCFFVYL